MFTDRDGFQYAVGHTLYNFSDGSIMVTCSASNGAFTSYGLTLLGAGHPQGGMAPCTAQTDVDIGTFGRFDFRLVNTLASVTTYTDAGSPSNNRTAALSCEFR